MQEGLVGLGAPREIGGTSSSIECRLNGDGGPGRAVNIQEFTVTGLLGVVLQHCGQIAFNKEKGSLALDVQHTIIFLIKTHIA